MLEDWHRVSTVPTTGIVAGFTTPGTSAEDAAE
jgi:hypothetical protein